MLRSHRLLLSFALAFAFVALTPAIALGQLVDTGTSRYEVQIWPEGDPARSVLIVGIRLPEDTPLPATVRLPVPDGATLTWAGEILGGDLDDDIPRAVEYVDVEGGQSVEFTLEETVAAQYDADYLPLQVRNGDYSLEVDWVQTEPAESVNFAARLPATVTDIEIDPTPVGSPQVNQTGEQLYSLSPIELAPGDSQVVEIRYSRPELGGGGSSGGGIIPWLIGAFALAVIALIAALVISRRRRGEA
jgi:hypothetical protein